MSDNLLSVTRQQLAQFIKDPRTLRAFELAVKNSNQLLPDEITQIYARIQEVMYSGDLAGARAQEALSSLSRIAQAVELLSLAPPVVVKLPDGLEGLLLLPPSEPAGAVQLHLNQADPHTQYGLKSGKLSQFAATTSAELAGVISDETGSGLLVFGTSPTLTTPKATSTIGVGNTTPAASGAGISFPAVASLSSDVNTLDDYEEGTWSPTYTPASGAFGSITVAGAGRYIKIGKTVLVWIDLRTTAATTLGTATGQLYITGFPFTADANGGYGQCSIIQAFNLGTAFTNLGMIIEASQTRAYLTKNSSNSGIAYVQTSELNLAAGSFNNLIGAFGMYQTNS